MLWRQAIPKILIHFSWCSVSLAMSGLCVASPPTSVARPDLLFSGGSTPSMITYGTGSQVSSTAANGDDSGTTVIPGVVFFLVRTQKLGDFVEFGGAEIEGSEIHFTVMRSDHIYQLLSGEVTVARNFNENNEDYTALAVKVSLGARVLSDFVSYAENGNYSGYRSDAGAVLMLQLDDHSLDQHLLKNNYIAVSLRTQSLLGSTRFDDGYVLPRSGALDFRAQIEIIHNLFFNLDSSHAVTGSADWSQTLLQLGYQRDNLTGYASIEWISEDQQSKRELRVGVQVDGILDKLIKKLAHK